MGFDLNDSSFDGKLIFNNGVAGIIENVSVSAEYRKPEDKENAPNLKVIFTDDKGGSVNMGVWSLERVAAENMEKATKSLGTVAKHIFHCIYGKATPLPVFKDDIDLINGIKKLLIHLRVIVIV